MFAAACTLRLGILFSTSLVPQTDGAYYLAQVRSILGGGGLRFSDTPLLFWIQALVALVLIFTTVLDFQSAKIGGVKLVDALAALTIGLVKMTGDLQKNSFASALFSLAMWAFDTPFRSGRRRD